MKEIKAKEKERARCVYVPPKVEVYAAEISELLAGTTVFGGTHGDGLDDNGLSGTHGNGLDDNGGSGLHIGGGDDGTVVGAKILGREFSFSNLWED